MDDAVKAEEKYFKNASLILRFLDFSQIGREKVKIKRSKIHKLIKENSHKLVLVNTSAIRLEEGMFKDLFGAYFDILDVMEEEKRLLPIIFPNHFIYKDGGYDTGSINKIFDYVIHYINNAQSFTETERLSEKLKILEDEVSMPIGQNERKEIIDAAKQVKEIYEKRQS